MAGIPEFTYNEPLGVKFGWMQSGPGAEAAVGLGDDLGALADRFARSDDVVGREFARHQLGSRWQGLAANAADSAVSQAAAAMAASSRTGKAGGLGSQRYGDSFGEAKRAIYVPGKLAASINSGDPVGANSTMGEIADGIGDGLAQSVFQTNFGIQSDYRARKQAYDQADQAAVAALKAHEGRTREALSAFQTAVAGPDPAPQGGLTASAGGPGAGAHGGIAGSSPGGSGGGPGVGGAAGGGHGGAAGTDAGAAGGPPGGGSDHAGPTSGARPGIAGHPDSAPATTAAAVPVGTGNVGWTPLPGVGDRALVPGPNGGLVPAALGPYPSTSPPDYPGRRSTSGNGGNAGIEPPLPARSGGPATVGGVPSGERTGAGARGAAGTGGVPPMGVGGVGAAAAGKNHRNQYYIPDDEPFRVEFDDVSPPVIGATDVGTTR